MKPPIARKLAVEYLGVRQLVFWLLVVSSFNYFKMHAWSTCMLLLLHSAFMLSMVKMLLKREVGGHAFTSHGNYIVDHGKIMELCILNSCGNPGIIITHTLNRPFFMGCISWTINWSVKLVHGLLAS